MTLIACIFLSPEYYPNCKMSTRIVCIHRSMFLMTEENTYQTVNVAQQDLWITKEQITKIQ